jgi:protein-S-isoprenylcysteine O-methyltransferase Ste14
MGTLARAVIYSTLFIGLLLVYLPSQVIESAGIRRPGGLGFPQVLGLVVGAAGALLAVWCILTFVRVGKGTPAPFDPPRRLVRTGPYRLIRNPMYVGAGLALLGAAIYYRSTALLAYLTVFMIAAHVLVRRYEEPTLHRLFGADFDAYCAGTPRWRPRL